LNFGPETRTPAMQAGLAKRRLSFRDVFTFLFAIIWMSKPDAENEIHLNYGFKLAWIHS
jgi:hypothetical protein